MADTKTDNIGKERMRKKRRLPKRHAQAIAAREAAGPREPGGPKPDGAAPRLMTVVLRAGHSINGQPYGPGEVTVDEGVATLLLEQEQRVVAEEQSFYGQRAVIVGPRFRNASAHKLIEVPYETFGQAFNVADPVAPKPNPIA